MQGFLSLMLFIAVLFMAPTGDQWQDRALYWAFCIALLGADIAVWLVSVGRL